MAHNKSHRPAPVPPGNRSPIGPSGDVNTGRRGASGAGGGAPFQEQDPKHRIGDFEGEGEHSRQQPGPLNHGQQHSR
jgi:hypothetical protein